MKTSTNLFLLLLLITFYSCKKNYGDNLEASNNFKLFNKLGVTPDMPPPGGGSVGTPIVKGSDGTYRCAYGGLDLNFGTNLFWPTNVQPSQNGTVYNDGFLEFHDSYNMILSYTIVNGRFALIIASASSGNGSLHTAITNYYTAFSNFVNRIQNPDTGEFLQSSLPQFNYGGSTSASVVTGQLVLDSTSPTHLSISPVTYINLEEPAIEQ